ncbi:hypothetical protein LTR53_005884 [Teratosphaeriaceae sp. CCFEE 6253]|nr:hypothetical protein LTR53_005884 [Teratosphaeriaceae sp. CCFEE 6253]
MSFSEQPYRSPCDDFGGTGWINDYTDYLDSQTTRNTQEGGQPSPNVDDSACFLIGRFDHHDTAGPYPALQQPNSLFAEAGGHRYLPSVLSDEILEALQPEAHRLEDGPFIGEEDGLYGSTFSPGELSRYGPYFGSPDPFTATPGAQSEVDLPVAVTRQRRQEPEQPRHMQEAFVGDPLLAEHAPMPVERPRARRPAGRARVPSVMQRIEPRPRSTVATSTLSVANDYSPLSPASHSSRARPAQTTASFNKPPLLAHVRRADGHRRCVYGRCAGKAEAKFQFHRLASDLRKHQRTHGHRPFPCDQCPYAARFAAHLTGHKRSVHGDAMFRCCECRRTYNRYYNLRRHFLKKHPELGEPKEHAAVVESAAAGASAPRRRRRPRASIAPDAGLAREQSVVALPPPQSAHQAPSTTTPSPDRDYASQSPPNKRRRPTRSGHSSGVFATAPPCWDSQSRPPNTLHPSPSLQRMSVEPPPDASLVSAFGQPPLYGSTYHGYPSAQDREREADNPNVDLRPTPMTQRPRTPPVDVQYHGGTPSSSRLQAPTPYPSVPFDDHGAEFYPQTSRTPSTRLASRSSLYAGNTAGSQFFEERHGAYAQ